tara:strand:+ start:425 stop:607 length:183 start_codon:yes stop_codon:yes gene_type:complete
MEGEKMMAPWMIEKLRREREERAERERPALRLPVMPPAPPAPEREPVRDERGTATINFNV